MSSKYTCPKCRTSSEEVVHLAWASINELMNWEGEGRGLGIFDVDDESFQCRSCGEDIKGEDGSPVSSQSEMLALFVEGDGRVLPPHIELAHALIEVDETASCPFCNKVDWGEDKHEENCPFHLAWKILGGNDEET